MEKYTIVADVLSILVSLIILYGTLFETKAKDKRRTALAQLIGFHILQSFFNILDSATTGGEPYWYLALIYSFTGAGCLILLALLVRYLDLIIQKYGVNITGRKRAFSIYCVGAAIVMEIMYFFHMTFAVECGQIVTKPGMTIYKALMAGAFLFYFYIVYSLIGRVHIREMIILCSYFLFPAILLGISRFILPGYAFGFSYVTLMLVLVYVMLQAKLFSASQIESASYFESVSSGYSSMHVYDLEQGTFEDFGADIVVRSLINRYSEQDMQERLWSVLRHRICEAHQDTIREFTDFSTLEERMRGKNILDIEVLNRENRWIRFSFLRIGKEEEGLRKVIFSSLDIDENKRKESELELMSMTDALTGIRNRHAYEQDVLILNTRPYRSDFWYLNIDVNGLKQANDTYGHKAGDELIIAMAKCVSEAVSDCGKAYRMGGDEFVAMLYTSQEKIQEILGWMKHYSENWYGSYGNKLSFSCGVVCSSERPKGRIEELSKEADRRMYEEKERYYLENHIDRRRR